MEFIKKYLSIINYCLLGIIFSFTSFFIIINILHYSEISKTYSVDFNTYSITNSIENNIKKINENIDVFDMSTYNGSISVDAFNTAKLRIKECINDIKNDKYLEVTSKNNINFLDVYDITVAYDNYVLNDCLNTSLSFINNPQFDNTKLKDNRDLINLQISSLMSETYYLKLDLLSNSSFYYSTNASSRQVKSNPRDSFDQIMSSYNRVTNLLIIISDWFKEEVTK